MLAVYNHAFDFFQQTRRSVGEKDEPARRPGREWTDPRRALQEGPVPRRRPSLVRSLSVLERPLGQHTERTIRVAGRDKDVIVKVAGDQVGANALGRQGS